MIAGVQEIERAREGVAFDERCVAQCCDSLHRSRILWGTFMFSRVKMCGGGVRPTEGGGDLDRGSNGYLRLRVLGDMNRLVGARMRVGITGAFGVP